MVDNAVLVTGGTGFLGSYVVETLVDAGHKVVAYDLSTDDRILSKLGVASDVEIRRGDVSEPSDVVRAVKQTGATHIVHLAALLTNSARDNPRAALDVNIQGTNAIFEAARTLDDQVERVTCASSAAVYAPPYNYDAKYINEDELVYPDTLYGATKEYNEHQARVYHEDYDVDHVALRPTVAYGPYRTTGGSAFLANIIEKPALGEPFSVKYGDQLIDWQHARDIAQAFRKATFVDESALSQRVYNVRGVLATIREATDTVRQIIPDAELEVSDEGELPWTQNLDMTAAQEDFGYEVEYGLEAGFRSYINTLREENGLDSV
jgi:nucleoside-diphosphate-sugar epimerase